MKKTATLVIAKYKEDIDWIYSITNPDIDIVILDKDKSKIRTKPLINNNKVTVIHLTNIGRESHSFLYYIATFYHRLNDYTIFSQGYPFDHFANMLEFINKKEYTKFKSLHDHTVQIVEQNKPTEIILKALLQYPPKSNNLPQNIGPMLSLHGFVFPCGAQFCVPKNYLLNRPKSFWKSLVKRVKWKQDEMMPYFFERIFMMIFDPYYKINPLYLKRLETDQ